MNQIKVNIASYSMACIDQNAAVMKLIGFDPGSNFSDHSKKFLKNVPLMQKRRLDTLGKAILPVYYTCCGNTTTQPLVFSSNHGNINLTYRLLKTMIEDDELSPTAFSLSVHNAIAGVISIIDGNQNDIVAIAPGDNGVLPALIEAITILNRQPYLDKVGVIFYDTLLPDFYQRQAEYTCDYSVFAACTVVSDSYEGESFSASFYSSNKPPCKQNNEHQQQIQLFFESLETKKSHHACAFNTNWQCSIS